MLADKYMYVFSLSSVYYVTVYMKKLRASDWLKKSAFSCNTSAKLCKVVQSCDTSLNYK